MSHISTTNLLSDAVAGHATRLQAQPPSLGDLAENGSLDMPNGMTPLMVAAACGNEAMVELLLLFGADPARRDAGGRTAAAYARAGGHPHLAARLDTVVEKENTIG